MNTIELTSLLDNKAIPRIAYGIGKLSAWDGFCIPEDEGVWSLVYSSRGKVTDAQQCANEDQACRLLLERLQEEFPILR